jgi:predicted metal-binding membrane protein
VNDSVNELALTHLRPAETRLAAILARPKPIAVGCVVALAALGWGACGLMLAGPTNAWLYALCQPALGRDFGVGDAALTFAMWTAMVLAMMLPTAGPMILTYAEIADTAARKSERVVSPMVLTAGYATVWLGFALIASLLQMLLVSSVSSNVATVQAPLSSAIFLTAGLYQFSSLKAACLTLCQRPFQFFFANWTTVPRGVLALGLRQGLYCLGCCWALMLVMFAVGTMNALWMAALGVLMTIEKMSTTARFSRAIGIAFVAIGVALVALEFS